MTSQAPRRATHRVVRRAVAALSGVLVVVLAGGCGTASDPSPPAGVDGLVIPTPSPDPDDFVEVVDNPWLPLEPGAVWTYRTGDGDEVQWSVEAGPEVDGIDTTALVSGDGPTDYYAQDEAGNVWWFGREGEWQAGEGGAEAGVAMLATPRLGDGYAQAEPGPRAQVVALDGVAETEAGAYEDLLVVETTEPDGRVLRASYARGAGLVSRETVTGAPDETLSLVSG